MPELPEVESMRRGLECLAGDRVLGARFPVGRCRPLSISPPPAELARRLDGATVGTPGRRGKRILLPMEKGGDRATLVIEPRMTGLVLLADPPTAAHVRMELLLAHGPSTRRLLFWDQRGLGTIRLLDDDGLERACGAAVLGPDGLAITAAELAARLSGSRRAIKPALLDQRAVAGVGNIYAAEILHRARIDPRARCRRLSAADYERLARETRRVLGSAVKHEGSSIGDELYRTVDNRKGGFQRLHRVYGREGLPCRTCGEPIRRIVQAQRSTFFCPACQRRRPSRGLERAGRKA